MIEQGLFWLDLFKALKRELRGASDGSHDTHRASPPGSDSGPIRRRTPLNEAQTAETASPCAASSGSAPLSAVAPPPARFQPARSPTRFQLTAVHEAAHAVLALLEGLALEEVSIVPDRDAYGAVRLSVPRDERGARVILAGQVAVELLEEGWPAPTLPAGAWLTQLAMRGMGLVCRTVPARDADLFREIARARAPNRERTFLERQLQCVRSALARHWSAIAAVGDALLDRGTLTGAEVRRIVARERGIA